jgi:hypothetical protein
MPCELVDDPPASPGDYARELADLFCAAATGRPPAYQLDDHDPG